MTWTKIVTAVRDVVVVVATVVGLVFLIRFLTRGKWPKLEADGPVKTLPQPPSSGSSDPPSSQDCKDWLDEKRIPVWITVLWLSFLLMATPLRAELNITNAVMGMYEYAQILDGTSHDRVTNVVHLGDGRYNIYFRLAPLRYPASAGIERQIIKVIPVKLEREVSTTTPWLYIIGSFALGTLIGIGIAR